MSPLALAMDALDAELEQWRSAGRTPRALLRDDDAVADTPALRRLFAICERHGAPLLLAAIPGPAEPGLGAAVRAFPLATGAVHGFAHVSHSAIGEKPCELNRRRPASVLLREMREGREKLGDLFGGEISGLLVPPWNRIHGEVVPLVAQAGFSGISAHGWEQYPRSTGLAGVHAHVDVVHWSAGARGRDPAWAITQTYEALGEARARGFRAIGLLAHHLAHDETAWSTLDELIGALSQRGVSFVPADSLIAGAVADDQA